jgi:hypothetical protein
MIVLSEDDVLRETGMPFLDALTENCTQA